MFKFRKQLTHMLRTGALPWRTAKLYGGSPTTLRKYRRIALEKKLTLEALEEMADSDLARLMGSKGNTSSKLHPDWEDEIRYLEKGYNRSEAHLRYSDSVPQGMALSYSAYCENLRNYLAKKDPVFRHVHVPARSMQADYAGYKPIGLDEEGNRKEFNLFVCVLPYSHYIYADVTLTQSTTDHIHSHIAALEFYGGAPEVIVTDNLKAAVIGHRNGRVPIINPRFLSFGEHYDIDIRPARVETPTDKASVEIAVKLVQRILRLRLNARPLMSMAEINKVVRSVIEDWNNRKMKRSGGLSRREKFEDGERELLQPLPAERLSFLDPPVRRQVAADYHVGFDNSFYSVDYRLIGEQVTVRASNRVVEIRHDHKVIAIHARSYAPYSYVTLPQHRPASHNLYLNDSIEDWAATQHPEVAEWALACIPKKAGRRDKDRILVRLRNVKAVHGKDRLVKAIQRAKQSDALTFTFVNDMLENHMEEVRLETKRGASPAPTLNVRGADYFAGGENVH